MLRVLDHLLRRSLLDDATQVHDADTVRHVLNHRQVVADEQVGQPELSLQILHEVEDLRLDGHVQGRDRLVGDDQVRRQSQRTSKTDALELAARELVRVAIQDLLGQANLLDDFHDALGDLPLTTCLLDAHGLGENLVDAHARIHRRVGVLEHHLHVAVDAHCVAALERGQVAPFQLNGTARGRLETRDEAAHRRLATTGLAHQAVGLALAHRDGHTVHGGDDALVTLEEAGPRRLVLARGLLDVEQDLRGHQRGLLRPGLVPVLLRVELCLQSRGRLVTLLYRVEAREGVSVVPTQVWVARAALVGCPQAAGRKPAAHRQVGQ